MSRFRSIISVSAAATLLLTACIGADEEAALANALNTAVGSEVASATLTETDCITAGLMTEIGTERFAEAGVNAESLRADSSLLRSGATSAQVDAVILSCVDLDSRFADAIADAGVASFEADCVEASSLAQTPISLALVDGEPLNAPQTDAGLTTAVVDAVRGCLDDTDFAKIAGLDSPAALREVLVADPFASDELQSHDVCIADAAVSHIGIERLAELGVTVENPDLLSVADDLTDDELDAFTASLVACDVIDDLTNTVSDVELQVGPCAVERLEAEHVETLVEDSILGRNILLDSHLVAAIDACTDEALDTLFGPAPDAGSEMSFAATFLGREVSAIAGANSYEEACVVRGFTTLMDIETLTEVNDIEIRFAAGEPITLEEELAAIEFSAVSAEIGAMCIEPWKRVEQDLTFAGITGDLAECTMATAGETPAQMISDGIPGLIRGEAAGTFDVLDGMDLIGDAIGDCGTSADVAKWESYLDSIFGPAGAEPAPIEA